VEKVKKREVLSGALKPGGGKKLVSHFVFIDQPCRERGKGVRIAGQAIAEEPVRARKEGRERGRSRRSPRRGVPVSMFDSEICQRPRKGIGRGADTGKRRGVIVHKEDARPFEESGGGSSRTVTTGGAPRRDKTVNPSLTNTPY